MVLLHLGLVAHNILIVGLLFEAHARAPPGKLALRIILSKGRA